MNSRCMVGRISNTATCTQIMKALGLVGFFPHCKATGTNDAPSAGLVWTLGARLTGFLKRITIIQCYTHTSLQKLSIYASFIVLKVNILQMSPKHNTTSTISFRKEVCHSEEQNFNPFAHFCNVSSFYQFSLLKCICLVGL